MRRIEYDNPRFPHEIWITRLHVPDNPFGSGEDKICTLYHGVGRAYTDTTTTGTSKIDENRRKCSIPVRFDRWKYEILDGDGIRVRVGNIVYDGVVKDVEPDNERTVVYWERPRVTD